MSDIVEINRILVIRNDTNTNWERSNYILEQGELGVAWLKFDDALKPVVKTGNGKDRWIDLPQNDYVITSDQILTHNFGRHLIDETGSVNAKGKGMLFSEWVLDAFRGELEPIIVAPSIISFEIKEISTDTNTYEIGSVVNKITYSVNTTNGEYQFGTLEDKFNKVPDLNKSYSVSLNGEVFYEDSELTNIPMEIETSLEITEEQDFNYGSLSFNYAWGESKNTPMTNLGNKAIYKIYEGNDIKTLDLFVGGYREGCFFGGILGEVDAELIRTLNKTGKNYIQNETYEFMVQPGDENIVIAYDARFNGPKSILNTTVNAEMLSNFVLSEVEIPGANNYSPITYKIMTYTPAEPYKNSANIKITLG